MTTFIENFKKYIPLLSELVSRDIKNKYRKSVLGVLWTVINPLFMMVVLAVVFSNLFKFDIENYPVYILSGQVIYNFYSESTTMSMSAIIDNAALIKKVYVPKYMFVLSRVFSSMINVLASHCALLIVMFATGIELKWTTFLFPIPMILLAVFNLGIGLLLATLTVKFRDIMHLYGVFCTALLYMTPIIYALTLLPDNLYMIVRANPLTNYLMIYRDLMLNGILPDPIQIVIAVIEAIAALLIGGWCFLKRQDTFIMDI